MSFQLPFEKYEICHFAVDLSVDIYTLTKEWPSEKKFGMISQIRRAIISGGANIAEGTSRFSEKEKARFIEISYGSLMEVAHFLYTPQRVGMITEIELQERKPVMGKLSNRINAFHKRLKS